MNGKWGLMNFFGNFDPDATVIVLLRAGRVPSEASAVAERLRREANLEKRLTYLRRGWEVWKEGQR